MAALRIGECELPTDAVEKLIDQANYARLLSDFLRLLPTNEAGELGF